MKKLFLLSVIILASITSYAECGKQHTIDTTTEWNNTYYFSLMRNDTDIMHIPCLVHDYVYDEWRIDREYEIYYTPESMLKILCDTESTRMNRERICRICGNTQTCTRTITTWYEPVPPSDYFVAYEKFRKRYIDSLNAFLFTTDTSGIMFNKGTANMLYTLTTNGTLTWSTYPDSSAMTKHKKATKHKPIKK